MLWYAMSNENLMTCYEISMLWYEIKMLWHQIEMLCCMLEKESAELTLMERMGIIMKVLLVVCKKNQFVDTK